MALAPRDRLIEDHSDIAALYQLKIVAAESLAASAYMVKARTLSNRLAEVVAAALNPSTLGTGTSKAS